MEAASAPSSIILHTAENPVSVAPNSVVEVWVEKLDPSLGEDFGWKREPGATVRNNAATPAPPPFTHADFEQRRFKLLSERKFLEAATTIQELQPIRLWPQLWSGSVTLPPTRYAGDRYRLAIAEFEEYLVDDLTPYNKTPSVKDRRIVFLQHIPFE
jgi:hypothetical protein